MWEKIDSLVTKKNIILLGVFAIVLGVFSFFFSKFLFLGQGMCSFDFRVGWCWYVFKLVQSINVFTIYALLLPPLLVIGFLSSRVFKPWAYFALLWMPVLMFVPYVASSRPNNFAPSDRGYVVIILLGLYILISLLIILVQSIRVYWLKK